MRWITGAQILLSFILLCVIFKRGSCCPHGWLTHGENCFRINTDPLTRFTARMRCIIEGYDLASISDVHEHQYLTEQLRHFRGDRFWIGLQYDDEEEKLSWMDGSNATEESWIKPYVPQGMSLSTSSHTDCFSFNGTLIIKTTCSENLGYICGHKSPEFTTWIECKQTADVGHSYIVEATSSCLFKAPEKTTNAKAKELCAAHQGHFADLDKMMKNIMIHFKSSKVLAKGGSKYWTGFTWNSPNIIASDSMKEYLRILFINGTGSCMTMQFNSTGILTFYLYQTDCDSEAQVMCSKIAESSEDFTSLYGTSEVLLNDMPPLSCPHGYNWKEENITGYCYWESSFETQHLSWDDAERYCQRFGGHLSSFHSTEEEKIGLSLQYGSLPHPYWIGLKLDPGTETYKWSDGTPLNYTNWAPGHPDHDDKRLRCVSMEAKEKHWVSSLCGIHSWYICKVPKQADPPSPGLPTPVPLQPCGTLAEKELISKSYCFQGSCYFTVYESYSWYNAKKFCENEGATLVPIHSDGEVEFLLKLLYDPDSVSVNNSVWIGLNALGPGESELRWTDWSPVKIPVDYKYFNELEGKTFQDQEKCYTMDTGNGRWNAEDCNTERSFICKRKHISYEVPTGIGNCKEGWISHRDRCYYLGGKQEKDHVSWTEAVDKCEELGGDLTSVRDNKDQGFLSYLLQSMGVDAWIGLHDTIEAGKYLWVDNTDVQYMKWALFENSSFFMRKDCVKMIYDTMDSGTWVEEECNRKMGYICYSEKDPNTPAPSNDQGINCLQPKGWLTLGSMCLKMFEGSTLEWQTAETSCKRYGAHLVSVSDKGVKAVLSYFAAEMEKPFWIGLQYKESTKTVNWLNGWPVTMTSWGKNEPSFMNDGVCIASTSDGYWKKSNCTEKMPYVCQITTDKPMKQKENTGLCPAIAEHWTPGNGSYCYKLEKGFRIDWPSAKHECSSNGSQLASIHSEEEINTLEELMNPGVKSVFLGLFRTKTGDFRWTDNTPVNFLNWDEGEPKNSTDRCVTMKANTMKWTVTRCEARRNFVCQITKEDSSGQPANEQPTSGQPANEQPANEQTTSGLSTGALVAIIVGLMIVLLLIVAGVYFRKKLVFKKFRSSFRQQDLSFENTRYNVNTTGLEFQG